MQNIIELDPISTFVAHVSLPLSKSLCNRALVLHALAAGGILEGKLSDCDDTRVVVSGLQRAWRGESQIDIGAAGTAMRFLTAYFAASGRELEITGSARMRQRPIGILVNALRSLGATIDYVEKEGFPPLRIGSSMLAGGVIDLDGSVSSQYISALMMIGAVLPAGLTLRFSAPPVSRPYIEMTAALMRRFGATVVSSEESVVVAASGYKSVPYRVEADWSAASYWYALVALSDESSEAELFGLESDSLQGDARLVEWFAALGVRTEFTVSGVRISRMERTATRMDIDFASQPDLAQTFAVVCCLLNIPYRFTGLSTLFIKETDRVAALCCELSKLGYRLNADRSGVLSWEGDRMESDGAPIIATYDDHRMAMSFAVAALRIKGLRIADPGVVCKSYPRFWEDVAPILHPKPFEVV